MDEKLNILIVDDHALSRSTIKMALQFLVNCTLKEAGGGKDAITQLEQSVKAGPSFHLIICDWLMPEVDGMAVLKWVRSHPKTKDTPFVMCTAEQEMKSVTQAIKAGASGYITKPITSETFREKINPILKKLGHEMGA